MVDNKRIKPLVTSLAKHAVTWAEEGVEPTEAILRLLRVGIKLEEAAAVMQEATEIIAAKQFALAKHLALAEVGWE